MYFPFIIGGVIVMSSVQSIFAMALRLHNKKPKKIIEIVRMPEPNPNQLMRQLPLENKTLVAEYFTADQFILKARL